MHGYGNDSCSWRNHLRAVARHGAVGVAMDYTGQDPKTNRGWRVSEGAEDSIKSAKYRPIAGHAWEGSDTQLVIRVGFEQLWKVMGGKTVGPYRETVVHGEGLRVPLP